MDRMNISKAAHDIEHLCVSFENKCLNWTFNEAVVSFQENCKQKSSTTTEFRKNTSG